MNFSSKAVFSAFDGPEPGDKQLGRLMDEWRDLDAGPGFEDAVWRRIGMEKGRSLVRTSGVVLVLSDWLSRPLLVNAAAILIGISLGAWAGSVFLTPAHDVHTPVTHLMDSSTVAGSYLAMARGGTR